MNDTQRIAILIKERDAALADAKMWRQEAMDCRGELEAIEQERAAEAEKTRRPARGVSYIDGGIVARPGTSRHDTYGNPGYADTYRLLSEQAEVSRMLSEASQSIRESADSYRLSSRLGPR